MTSTCGITKFADWTQAEFKQILGYKADPSVDRVKNYVTFDETVELAANVDWRGKGAVTGVKDQG